MDLQKTLAPWLGKTSKMLGCLVNEVLAVNNINLTREQWLVLLKLNQQHGLAQNQLAMFTERDKTSLTRLIHTMERKGLVIRKKAENDKRVNLVYATEFGVSVFKKSLPIMQQIIQKVQKGLTQKEIESTLQILKKIQKNITRFTTNCGTDINLKI